MTPIEGVRVLGPDGISVDDKFARFGGKSFAINKINSVEVRSATSEGKRDFALYWLMAGICVVIGLAQQVPWLIVGGLVLALPGWLSWRRRHTVTTYTLVLVNSGSEASAFITTDRNVVMDLRRNIEDAMSRST